MLLSMLRCLLIAVALGSFPAHGAAQKILVYGDSLSAAYGISQKDGWVTLLAERIQKQSFDYTVVNASISGETSAGGASRIAAALAEHKPAILVLALGANDGLRGLTLAQMRENLSKIVSAAQRTGAKVLVAGMKMPPNYGQAYTREFEESFARVSRHFKTAYLPFLIDGVADKPDLFQPDRLHPTAEAQPLVLENVWKVLRPMLKAPVSR